MIGIFLGSLSDFPSVKPAISYLKSINVPFEAHVCSAHRTPDELVAHIHRLDKAGFKVYIGAAGRAAHLAGTIAAHTIRPVIGLPISGGHGLDSLLSTVQMPPGVPVATVGVDAAKNAAILAVQILATADAALKDFLVKQKYKMTEDISIQNQSLQKEISECR
jgi:5-(carboxyamino)imidazole ribonucleotide mutase